jgi:hypothetical protein
MGIIAATGISQLASVGKSSGGGGTTGYSGGVPVQNTRDVVTAPEATLSRAIDITINGIADESRFTGQQVRELIQRINEEVGNGARIQVS